MDSLKDLTSFLKNKECGASMSDLKDVFHDEVELKKFIKSGLDLEVIFKEGEKRGTRYYAAGVKPQTQQAKNEKKQKKNKNTDTEEDSYENTLDHNGMDVYLNSDKPMVGMGVFQKILKFGSNKDSNLKDFLMSGREIESNYVMYSKQEKRNRIIEKDTDKQYNKIAIRKEGRKFMIIYYCVNGDTMQTKNQEFPNYEELREELLSKIN